MFILGTASVLVFTRPEGIDLVSHQPSTKPRCTALRGTRAAFLLVTTFLAHSSLRLTFMTRMPMVAGWDRLFRI